MSDIVNLKAFRKRKKRIEKENTAEQNRQLFGRTGTQKAFDKREQLKTKRFLEQNRLETEIDDPASPDKNS